MPLYMVERALKIKEICLCIFAIYTRLHCKQVSIHQTDTREYHFVIFLLIIELLAFFLIKKIYSLWFISFFYFQVFLKQKFTLLIYDTSIFRFFNLSTRLSISTFKQLCYAITLSHKASLPLPFFMTIC